MPLTRREFCLAAALGSAALLAPVRRVSAAPWAGYDGLIVIDGLGGPGAIGVGWGSPLTAPQLSDVRSSGITCTHITVGSVGRKPTLRAYADIVESIAFWDAQVETHPDTLMRVRNADDVVAAKRAGLTGLVYGLQDGVSFETDLDRLTVLHQLGVRIVQPTYNRRNLLGDGCMEPADGGLSRAGREAIERMDTLGILVDLSHCGRRTAADAMRISRRPVAFTHTGCAAVTAHPRHRTDAELRAVAESGGVVGIYVMPYLNGGRQPTAADVIAHLEHAVDVAGEEHVAIGTDGYVSPTVLTDDYRKAFADNVRARRESGIAAPGETETGYLFAADLNTPRRLETLADMLAQRGHSESRVEKILGANLLRLFGDTWSRPDV